MIIKIGDKPDYTTMEEVKEIFTDDGVIIASGKILPSAYGMLIGDKTMQEVSNRIAEYWNKNIEIIIKVVE
jgi:hypothetical protein